MSAFIPPASGMDACILPAKILWSFQADQMTGLPVFILLDSSMDAFMLLEEKTLSIES